MHMATEKCTKRVPTFAELIEHWTSRVIKLIDSDLKTFKSVLDYIVKAQAVMLDRRVAHLVKRDRAEHRQQLQDQPLASGSTKRGVL